MSCATAVCRAENLSSSPFTRLSRSDSAAPHFGVAYSVSLPGCPPLVGFESVAGPLNANFGRVSTCRTFACTFMEVSTPMALTSLRVFPYTTFRACRYYVTKSTAFSTDFGRILRAYRPASLSVQPWQNLRTPCFWTFHSGTPGNVRPAKNTTRSAHTKTVSSDSCWALANSTWATSGGSLAPNLLSILRIKS